jgi:hypothetical protein
VADVVALLGGDGEEGWCTFVGVQVLEFVEVLFGEGGDVEDGDAETGDGGSAFVVGGVENQAEDQMMGMEVGAATEGGVVSCDFGGGESLDWEIGGDGESETDGFGWSGGEIDFGVEDRGPSFVGAFRRISVGGFAGLSVDAGGEGAFVGEEIEDVCGEV